MGIMRYIIALLAVPHVVFGDPLALDCVGTAPEWHLNLRPEGAAFSYLDRQSEMTIPQSSTAEGADWPKAMTLIAPRDSAIVILHDRACFGGTHEAQVLTQRGETPVLLTGCCRRVD